MHVEVISIGTELITGRVSDTNSNFLIRELRKIGLPVNLLTIVGDDEHGLENVFDAALARSDVVITSGGLGSTHDDLTKRCAVKVFNRKLILSEEALDNIKKKFEQNRFQMPTSVQKQALVPRRSVLIPNKYGIAPGFICEEKGMLVICLPGVPKEMIQMWSDEVRAFLTGKFGGVNQEKTILVRTCGLMEMEVNDILAALSGREGLTWTLTAGSEGVDVEFFYKPPRLDFCDQDVTKLKAEIKELLGKSIYAWISSSMEELVGNLLMERNMTVAIAESCTGGLTAHRLTQVTGSSKYFEMGFVTYSNRSKQELLDVRAETLNKYGAVSSNVALEMAIGAKTKACADMGLGITGIAGPGGGSEEKPVGLAYCAISSIKGCSCQSFRFMGDRDAIKMKCSQAGLNMIRQHLEERNTE
ncbi:competence/damage-inducible protein A [bacterium]|nr:competence/damage-inducible protein A [bacterium]